MIKVVVIGPESTGKTTLAQALAAHFNTNWVPEFARIYLDELKRPYKESDLLQIARGQLEMEDTALSQANERLFCDTDLRVIKIWSLYRYGRVNDWISEQISHRLYDLYLLMDIDLPWKPDPQREHPHERAKLLGQYRQELHASSIPYVLISGKGPNRLERAIEAVRGLSNEN